MKIWAAFLAVAISLPAVAEPLFRPGVAGLAVNPAALTAPQIEVQAGGQDIEFRGAARGDSWAGIGRGGETLRLVTVRGITQATMRTGARTFTLERSGSGSYGWQEVDLTKQPPHLDPLPPRDRTGRPVTIRPSAAVAPPRAGEPVTIDLLALYTPAAAAANGGTAGIEGKIALAIADTNQAYLNSGITASIRIVRMQEIAYVESGPMTTSLSNLTYADGVIDTVHALRDQYGADMVTMITQDSDYCGVAWVMQANSSSFAPYAYSVVYSACLPTLTLAHELGHNQGMAHDRANSSVAGAYPYAYGYANGAAGWYTVMSYRCPTCSTRILHFSNPAVNYNGQPTGIDHAISPAMSADAARTMNQTLATVLQFRLGTAPPPPPPPPPPGTVPTAPSNLTATLGGPNVTLAWADNSGNETGFSIEQRMDGGVWSVVLAQTAGPATLPVSVGRTYDFRVSAYNATGYSVASNVATVTPVASAITLALSLQNYTSGRGAGRYIQFVWAGAGGQKVWLEKNEKRSDRGPIPNDGYEAELLPNGLHKTWQYRVCEAAPLVGCSPSVLITF